MFKDFRIAALVIILMFAVVNPGDVCTLAVMAAQDAWFHFHYCMWPMR